MNNFYNSVRGLLLEESSTKNVTVSDVVEIFDILLEFEVKEAERLRMQSLFGRSDDGFEGMKQVELYEKFKVPGFTEAFKEWTIARFQWRDIYKREMCGLRISRSVNPYNPEPISAIESVVARAAAQRFVDAKARYLAFLDKLSAPVLMAPADIPVRMQTVQFSAFRVIYKDLFKNTLPAFGESNQSLFKQRVAIPLPFHPEIDVAYSCRESMSMNYSLTFVMSKNSVEFMRATGDGKYGDVGELVCSWRAQIVDSETGHLISNGFDDIMSFLDNPVPDTKVIQVDELPDT